MLVELILSEQIIRGDSGKRVLAEIFTVFGSPSTEQIREMKVAAVVFDVTEASSCPLNEILPRSTLLDAIRLVSDAVQFSPKVVLKR